MVDDCMFAEKMQLNNDDFFTVVGDGVDVVKEVEGPVVEDQNVIDVNPEAVRVVDYDIPTETDNDESRVNAKYIKLVKQNVKQLKSLSDPAEHLNKLIYATYNTSCVTTLDMLNAIETLNVSIDLDLYTHPVFAFILDIEEPWVKNIIDFVKEKWSTSAGVKEYVDSYLIGLGVIAEDIEANKEALLTLLPEVIINEDSPIEYKHYKAVELLCSDKSAQGEIDNFDYEEAILKETSNVVNYAASVKNNIEDGAPAKVSEAIATEEVVRDMPNEDPVKKKVMTDSIAAGVGNFCGKIIKMKYSVADSFDNALRESLGNYVDDWDATVVNIKEKQREKREVKEIAKQVKKEAKDEEKLRRHELQMNEAKVQNVQPTNPYKAVSNQRGYETRRGYNPYVNNQQYMQRNMFGAYDSRRNFAPNIPMEIMACGVNIIIALICLLLFKGRHGSFCCIGLGLSCFGFIRKKLGEVNAIPMILIGYVIFILALFLTL